MSPTGQKRSVKVAIQCARWHDAVVANSMQRRLGREDYIYLSKDKMYKLFVPLIALLGGFFTPFAAIAGLVSWQEEVKLIDGRVIVVEQKRRCPDATCRTAPEAWLKINLPEFSDQPILWHEKLNPLILNTQKGVLYVVATPPSCRESLLYGDPVPFYIPFKYEHGQWSLIRVEDIPVEIYDVNMLIPSVPQDGTQLLSVDQKLSPALNGRPGYQKQMKHIDLSFRGQRCRDNSSNDIRRATRYSAEPSQELSMAIQDSDIETVRSALKAGASVKSQDKADFLPLVSAVMAAGLRRGAPEPLRIIDLLIEAGADIELSGPVTPLDAAVRNGPPEVVEYLLKKGANVNAKTRDGRTALFQSVRRGTTLATEVLIRHGANVNAQTEEGWVPLHIAIMNGMDSTVALLLASGANVNARDNEGKTPLSWATGNASKIVRVSRAKSELIEMLVKNGATE